jgi:hypothetical protein
MIGWERKTMKSTAWTRMMTMMEEMLLSHHLLLLPLPLHLLLLPPPPKADTEEDEDPEMMIAKQEAPEALAVILPNEEPEPPQPYLFTMLMRDHEESQSRVYDDLDDSTIAEYDVDEWFPKVGSHD